MKRVLATILAFIYLSTSVGATLHLHYCMGKLASWGLVNRDNKNCSFCGMPKNTKPAQCMLDEGGCCKDEQKQVNIEKDQKAPEASFKIPTLSLDIIEDIFATRSGGYAVSYEAGYPTTNGPPGLNKVPVFLRNCNFRI